MILSAALLVAAMSVGTVANAQTDKKVAVKQECCKKAAAQKCDNVKTDAKTAATAQAGTCKKECATAKTKAKHCKKAGKGCCKAKKAAAAKATVKK